ncbi:hypothetical protein F5876DRAFT_71244 [Lentinula aff. lateritia]|uniref:Uncharacterized protein n=1 Tax=Lentinula aff. lateritia TaxID=2804960 RepID=A0ACC1TGY3_9AGAR|nr:hypothetical protein F5876DRAFT_71244 [Lentinula aff. lateritia]
MASPTEDSEEVTYETMFCPRRTPDDVPDWCLRFSQIKERAKLILPPGKEVPAKYRLDRVRLRRDPDYVKPEKLYWAFGINIQDCVEYHRKHNLPRPPPGFEKGRFIWSYIMCDVEEDLRKHCHYGLRFLSPVSVEYALMIIIYDSHSIAYSKLIAHEEDEVVQIIKDRMDVCKNQEPRWFFCPVKF